MIKLYAISALITGIKTSALENMINVDEPWTKFVTVFSDEYFTSKQTLMISASPDFSENIADIFQNLHNLNRWPIIHDNNFVRNHARFKPIYDDKHGGYIILVGSNCSDYENVIEEIIWHIQCIRLKIFLFAYNPRAPFLICLKKCSELKMEIVASLHNLFWRFKLMNAALVLLIESEARENVWGIYTWHPFENSKNCHYDMNTSQPLSCHFSTDIKTSLKKCNLFQWKISKDLHGCPLRALVREHGNFVETPTESNNTLIFESGWDIQLYKLILKTLHMTEEYVLAPENYNVWSDTDGKTGYLYQSIADIAIGCVAFSEAFRGYEESTKTYYTIRLSWYSPCAIKLPRWNSLLRIFSADLWVSVTFALILGALTMMVIARFGKDGSSHKEIIIAFLNVWASILGVSVSSMPQTNALRLFFFAWVCYGIAINTVFQAYFTSYLIDPGYEKPITTVEEMVNSKKPFGYNELLDDWFDDSSDPIAMEILKNRIHCPDYDTFIHWAANYHNFSSIINNVKLEYFFWNQTLIDENNKPMLCQLSDGTIYHKHVAMIMTKGNPLVRPISKIINCIYEAGIFLQWEKITAEKVRLQSRVTLSESFANSYMSMGLRELQSAYFFMFLGYLLALLSFIIEIVTGLLLRKNY